jgi:hypothetical protein
MQKAIVVVLVLLAGARPCVAQTKPAAANAAAGGAY